MKKRFLTKCVTTMLAASMLISSVGVPVNAGEMAENVLVEADETSSLYVEEEQDSLTESTLAPNLFLRLLLSRLSPV